jgi:hypothetical protein
MMTIAIPSRSNRKRAVHRQAKLKANKRLIRQFPVQLTWNRINCA